jgi:dTDP-4-amino-4,6-dideoxy-D-galactose acyltransferase
VAAAIDEARHLGMKLAYWFVDPADSAAADLAKEVNARLVDRKVTYLLDVANITPSELDTRLEKAIDATPQLRFLAIQSGHYSRYKVDPGFSPTYFERMYNIWLERSVSGAIAKEVIVFKDDGKELGFATIGIKNGRANIGLIAVDADSRSKGIGAHLINAAVAKSKDWGVDQIDVVTQKDNIGACRFYERSGFVQEKIEHIYHIWL